MNSYLEFLTLRAIYEVYLGNTTYQADRVKDDFDNINKPANASDLEQRLSQVPAQGIEALVRPHSSSLAQNTMLVSDHMAVIQSPQFSQRLHSYVGSSASNRHRSIQGRVRLCGAPLQFSVTL